MRFTTMMNLRSFLFAPVAVIALTAARPATSGVQVLDPQLHHLRAGNAPEWSDFPAIPEGPHLTVRFPAERNNVEATLSLQQQDVKQLWQVLLNGQSLGRLIADENDMVIHLPIPAGFLSTGENTLRIQQVGTTPDDIRVGRIALDERPPNEVLSEATVDVRVLDGDHGNSAVTLPCRITVLDSAGALATLRVAANDRLAARTGVIYTGSGIARFALPAGRYTIYAGRGFEYSVDSACLSLQPGDAVRKQLMIRREVATPGYVSCDTHIHTLTNSGHGDANVEERMLTLAGEGIELPVATEHNRQLDYHESAVKMGVRDRFTPLVGNEVTTTVGHFNIFPAPAGGPVPDHTLKDWRKLSESISQRTGARIVILNHPRDVHAGFRPFGPEHFNDTTGENLDGWQWPANAVEVVNSGAQQTDVMRLCRDWMALLNRGVVLTPVGSSDSHDVSRFIVGQGRTYIRCRDSEPRKIDIAEAVDNFLQGRVLVSCGLLTDITVNGKYGPGDLVPASDGVRVTVQVSGPGWVQAEKLELYANGMKVREAAIPNGKRPGFKFRETWTLPRFSHDAHLVAIATGPGVTELYWPLAKPYQPTSPNVDRRVIGITGAVWIDGDADGKRGIEQKVPVHK